MNTNTIFSIYVLLLNFDNIASCLIYLQLSLLSAVKENLFIYKICQYVYKQFEQKAIIYVGQMAGTTHRGELQ